MGFLRRLFGRDFEASTVYTGRVLTADTTIDSGLKWASPLPTPASAGQVIKSTGAVEGGYGWYAETAFSLPTPSTAGQVLKATGNTPGAYTWGTDNDTIFSLPTPSAVGQILTANGTTPGAYAWSAAPSNLWFTNNVVYEVHGTPYTFLADPGEVLRILLIGGGSASSAGTLSSITENSNPLLVAYPGGSVVPYAFYDVSKISPISLMTTHLTASLYRHPLFVSGIPGYGEDGNGYQSHGGWLDVYYRNTTGSVATLTILIGQAGGGSGTAEDGGCIIQYN